MGNDFERALGNLDHLADKAGLRHKVRLQIVCRTDEDRTYLLRAIEESLQSPSVIYPVKQEQDRVFQMRGIEVRVLS